LRGLPLVGTGTGIGIGARGGSGATGRETVGIDLSGFFTLVIGFAAGAGLADLPAFTGAGADFLAAGFTLAAGAGLLAGAFFAGDFFIGACLATGLLVHGANPGPLGPRIVSLILPSNMVNWS
jgi:hypothetical protein